MIAAPIKIAAAQYPIERFATLGAYRDKLARWVAEAAGNGAELLVFPEYGAMEYAAASGDAVAGDLAASLAAVSSAFQEMDAAHAELARRHRMHILAASGPSARPGGRYVNAARLFTPSGPVGVQEKMIMTPFERNWGISSGETLRVFETALGRIGIAICYDSEFPLLVRAQAEAGARIILVPSCTEFRSGYARVRTAAMARALENTCATVLSPTVGDAPWSPAVDRNAGAAGVYVPADHGFSETGVLAEGTLNAPQWVYAEVDLARLQRVKETGEMRNSTDWAAQPGAAPLASKAEVVALG
jgi:predicted amidohydrolase